MDIEFTAKTIYIQSSDVNNILQIYKLQIENKEMNPKVYLLSLLLLREKQLYKKIYNL